MMSRTANRTHAARKQVAGAPTTAAPALAAKSGFHRKPKLTGFSCLRRAWVESQGISDADQGRRALGEFFRREKTWKVTEQSELLKRTLSAASVDVAAVIAGQTFAQATRPPTSPRSVRPAPVAKVATAAEIALSHFYTAAEMRSRKQWAALAVFHGNHRSDIETGRKLALADIDEAIRIAPESARAELMACRAEILNP